ncbi:hypothetical protein [Pseudomonas guariconensis]|uniref:hypothetical protein n=1 Tax=Pseudomonas guariconensis TaxID=1288410 RepID=UPI0018AACF9C|nr:hypothetical protein [Pseudomonas guariconensis]MBF8742103.1 hypothetical protein [Pseudomonas guariconensis]MBF8751099.1 hypothetical protein [Pseudomonas guariconensis]
MNSVSLTNGKLNVQVLYAEEQHEILQRLLAFVNPVFVVQPFTPERFDLCLTLHNDYDFHADWRAACTQDYTIRRSTAEAFNINLRRGELNDGRQIAWHDRDATGYVWRQNSQQMSMYVNHRSFIHIIEFFRYYLLALEAAKGSVILHATGVVNRVTGKVLAICGAKGAGKTSTMLNMTLSSSFEYFSGDKLLVDIVDNEIRVRGWPDYPHVGVGTLRQHPDFCLQIGLMPNSPPLSIASDRDKFLFAPELFYGALGKSRLRAAALQAVLLPNVLEDNESLNILDHHDKCVLDENKLFEDPLKFITATWHGLALPDPDEKSNCDPKLVREKLFKLDWLRLSGNVSGSVLDAALNKRKQLRLAFVASSGSGKSTAAALFKEVFIDYGLSVSVEKLARPLYILQQCYFEQLGQSINSGKQHQGLMEKIADNLRMLDPRALVDNLFERLSAHNADVILTDDLRDKQVDLPELLDKGYIIVRVICDEDIRQSRLSERQDLQSLFVSKLDSDINSIESNFTICNSGSIDELKEKVSDMVKQLLKERG